MIGNEIHQLAKELWPICRSITGNGVRETLSIIKRHLPNLKTFEVPTGTQCFDWTVPKEWNIRDAFVIDPDGNKIIDFKISNLHVVGYSTPVNKKLSLEELKEHLYTLPEQPDAIPYITSYYSPHWGFCLTQTQFEQLKEGEYHVVIDSDLEDGHLTYAELLIPGESDQEIFLSTYVCHPSLANNELSGPTVTTFLAKWLLEQPQLKYSYRIIFIPETIGSLTYLSRHADELKKNVVAGFNITCIGDDRDYSYIPSRDENTLSDKVAKHVLRHVAPSYKTYPFIESGSDERRYCAPGIDLPIACLMRTKYNHYPEYHTSLDDLTLVTPKGLQGGYEVLRRCIEVLEKNEVLKLNVICEPQLGKRGLYPNLSTKQSNQMVSNMMNYISYCDGILSNIEIAQKINVPLWGLYEIIQNLKDANLLALVDKHPK
jgi:aminopeptidase-like protein